MQTLVLTLVGEDRPGIVDLISKHVLEHQGNWLASSLSKMAGQFAGIVQITLPEAQVDKFRLALQQIDKLQILITLDQHLPQMTAENVLNIELMGNDKTGIVQDITHAIHQAGASVIKMQTSCESAPNWGGELFKAQLQVGLTADANIDEIREHLEAIANDLVVDLSLTQTE